MKCALELIEEDMVNCLRESCLYQSECPQWQEHQLRLKATELLRRVVDLVSVHLETEHGALYREIDEFFEGGAIVKQHDIRRMGEFIPPTLPEEIDKLPLYCKGCGTPIPTGKTFCNVRCMSEAGIRAAKWSRQLKKMRQEMTEREAQS